MRGALLLLGLAALMAACAARSLPEDGTPITVDGAPLVINEQMERASAQEIFVTSRALKAMPREEPNLSGGIVYNGKAPTMALIREASRSLTRQLKSLVRPAIQDGGAAPPGRYPYYVSMRKQQNEWHFCGASVINYGTRAVPGKLSGKILVSAAHCFENSNNVLDRQEYNPFVLINPYYREDPLTKNRLVGQFPPDSGSYKDATVFRTVYATYPHPSYNFGGPLNASFLPTTGRVPANALYLEHDIAIVVLDAQVGSPGNGTGVNPGVPTILLPPEGSTQKPGLPVGTPVRVIGMGQIDPGPPILRPDVLMQGIQEIVNTTGPDCAPLINGGALGPPATNSRMCAGGPGYSGFCSGDSGGPMFSRAPANSWLGDQQFGVVSYRNVPNGNDPCTAFPGVYTSLVAERAWIKERTDFIEGFLTEYTIDIFTKIKDTASTTFAGPLPAESWVSLAAYLTYMLDKQPGANELASGRIAITVDYYSYRATGGRIRFKWSSQQKRNVWQNYLTTGSKATPCVVNSTCSYPWGTCNCNSGPFTNVARPANNLGEYASLYPAPNLQTYFRETVDQLEDMMNKGFEVDSQPGFNATKLQVTRIVVWNGYYTPATLPTCVSADSGAASSLWNACYKELFNQTAPAF